MNIAVIGLGSMGKRRIRHIKDMYPDYTVVGDDGREDRRAELEKITQIKSFSDISKIDLKVDCAFICTPPLTHASIITECLNRRWNVFTELNLIDADYKTNMALARKKVSIYRIGIHGKVIKISLSGISVQMVAEKF